MSFIKIKKNKAYHSRFQVKWRRRREGKTDYYSRKRLIFQDKRRFNSPKYRIVVRISKKNIICQLVQSKIEGDQVLCSAYSRNLKEFGIFFSFTSFPAAYTTGLLLGKRISEKKNIGEKKRPLKNFSKYIKAILDIGLTRATTGHKVFGAMKGLIDGGIFIPHTEKRFPGYNLREGFRSELLEDRIRGKHIVNYMKEIKDEDEDFFAKQFKNMQKNKIEPDNFQFLFETANEKIKKY